MKKVGIVMAGGWGERFWPLSTPERPKQLLDLTGSGKSLLAEAVERIQPLVDEVVLSTSQTLAPTLAASGLVPEANVIAEPAKRNTGGALIWVMAELQRREGTHFLAAVVTADHAIRPVQAFQHDVRAAMALALYEEALVVIGIPPTRPETGFGYVKFGVGSEVLGFVEKPDVVQAAKYVASGDTLWNSGMFFWRSDIFAKELEGAHPAAGKAYFLIPRVEHDEAVRLFDGLPDLSIDYLLMEKSKRIKGVRASFEWDDLGSWDALRRVLPLDNQGNAVVGPVRLFDCSGCVVYNATPRQTTVIGCRDMIVVSCEEHDLVLPLSQAQAVRRAAQASPPRAHP